MHYCPNSKQGCGVSRHHVLASMLVISPSSVALDTGDADEFTFSKAGDFACFWGLCRHEQGKVVVAS
ncbi:hypothetical protein OOJ09_24935 [Mesorhizobium qingshengii]|uniref:Uncharacterized protein n=1 Tax=Mesorhizobium qingshengii TaxID=1165689 RepID=A0ABT4R0T8_9HYPH|nr:hypothetical protein [Mesorhizobium qingshengii]MCZ8547447.1 hypothetical protein [Mesorhizobium qingshengii]